MQYSQGPELYVSVGMDRQTSMGSQQGKT